MQTTESNETSVKAGGLAIPARPLVSQPPRSVATRRLVDRLATKLVSLGGLLIIASILAILFVIVFEVYPLLVSPHASLKAEFVAQPAGQSARILGLDVDEYQEIAATFTETGVCFYSLKDKKELSFKTPKALGQAKIVSISPQGRGTVLLGLSDGRAIPVKVVFTTTYVESKRQVAADLTEFDPLELDEKGRPLSACVYMTEAGSPVAVAKTGPREVVIGYQKTTKNMMGAEKKELINSTVKLPVEGEISAMVLDNRHENLYVGTSAGMVIRVNLDDPEDPQIGKKGLVTSGTGIGITAMAYVLGDRTVVIGDADGKVSTWLQAKGAGYDTPLVRIHEFKGHAKAITAIACSKRNKGFLTAGADGQINLHYATTGETLLGIGASDTELKTVFYAPKADGVLSVDAAGKIDQYHLHNPHPEVTIGSLFGKLWYEGYEKPEHVWQSTGGTDDFESKLGLTPLVFGTLKAAMYALLFAIPIALLGAMYTSQFMHPSIRAYVKPMVEVMAGLPSVVLGFIAGLWLAPAVERIAPGVFLLPVVMPAMILAALMVWRVAIPNEVRIKLKPGTEVLLLIPVVAAGGLLSFWLGFQVENIFMGGDFREFLNKTWDITYDQRNSMVVGMAMGFAVIPIIFTISEDSLSNVPNHLTAGALALGATRWQTATRIVLPTASPGIFSAIMIGFGRAVGETMIVLMATGNTPVMDWSIFNGFRALSANIAVELPEAPEGGTLYRVLFLAALLLFIMTFVVNTVAEVIRLRLRKKFRYI